MRHVEAYLALNTFLLDYIYIIVFTRTLGNALSTTLNLSLLTYCTMLINASDVIINVQVHKKIISRTDQHLGISFTRSFGKISAIKCKKGRRLVSIFRQDHLIPLHSPPSRPSRIGHLTAYTYNDGRNLNSKMTCLNAIRCALSQRR